MGRAVLIPLSVPLLTHHEVWKLETAAGAGPLQGLLWRSHLSKLRAFQALPESKLESVASCPGPQLMHMPFPGHGPHRVLVADTLISGGPCASSLSSPGLKSPLPWPAQCLTIQTVTHW